MAALLDANNYAVLQAAGGKEALSMMVSYKPDLLLLDLGLPDMDGMEVLRGIRDWTEIPVIIVSARQSEYDKVAALDAGANDYITKPFGSNELLARIRAVTRFYEKLKNNSALCGDTFSVNGLKVDYVRRLVFAGEKPVHFTPIEYRIMVLLSRNAGKVLTHDHIIREIWGPFGGDSQLLRVNMANIRRKIEPDPASPRYILTEPGVGYRMADNEPSG